MRGGRRRARLEPAREEAPSPPPHGDATSTACEGRDQAFEVGRGRCPDSGAIQTGGGPIVWAWATSPLCEQVEIRICAGAVCGGGGRGFSLCTRGRKEMSMMVLVEGAGSEARRGEEGGETKHGPGEILQCEVVEWTGRERARGAQQ